MKLKCKNGEVLYAVKNAVGNIVICVPLAAHYCLCSACLSMLPYYITLSGIGQLL